MQELVGTIVGGVASVLFLVSFVWVLVLAFRESLVWGLLSFLFWPVGLVFALTHVRECKRPLLLGIASFLLASGAGAVVVVARRGPTSFDLKRIVVPDLPSFRGAKQAVAPGVVRYEVSLGPGRDGYYETPGHGGRLLLYLPDTPTITPGSLPCILIAGAGTYGYDGMLLGAEDEPEHVPYAAAGMAVVAYDLDGPLDSPERDDATFDRAYAAYSAAMGGLVNAHIALEYVLACVPEVNQRAIYAAGHSSAGAVAFTVAANEPRLAGVISYAPPVDYVAPLASLDPSERRRLTNFARLISPLYNAPKVRQPVFLFQAKDDSRCPYDQAVRLDATLRRTNQTVTFVVAEQGEHHDSMIQEGIPAAIAWLRERHPEVTAPLATAVTTSTERAVEAGVGRLLREVASDDPVQRAEAVAEWTASGFDREEGARLTMLQALAGHRLDTTIDRHLAKSMRGSAMSPAEVLRCLPLAPPQTRQVLLQRITAPGVSLPREQVLAVLEKLNDDRELHVEEALVLFGGGRPGCAARLVAARGEEWPMTEEGRRTLAALPPERALELLASDAAPSRVLGARLLAAKGPDVALEAIAPLIQRDPSGVVRQEVALLLEVMKEPRSAPALARALRTETDESARARIRRALSVLPGQGAAKALVALLAAPEVEERLAAIAGLEALASPDGVRPLTGALLDADRAVAIAACRALEALRASRVPGVPDLVNQQARDIGKAALATGDDELKRLARHLYFLIRGRLPEQDGLR